MLAKGPILVFLAFVMPLASGCGEDCKDNDGDGFGEGCERGADCDDSLPSRTTDCSLPAPDCDEDRFLPGCQCYAGEARACYPVDDATLDVGICSAGRQSCRSGGWSECRGAVLPGFETCNDLDDDCDGWTDETVRSPCGGCNDACTGGVWGEGEARFEANDQLALGPRDELVLKAHPLETATVFVPNTGEGTVSAVDPDSALERARYRTLAERPVQIAIDYRGDAWVLGKTARGSALTHIAGDEQGCSDRDGDGLETSHGASELLALGDDECVVQYPLPDDASTARALTVSGLRAPDQDEAALLWVGLPDEEALIAVHGGTGEVIDRIETPGLAPYAATFDPWGTLWVIDRSGILAEIETALSPPTVRVIEAQLRCYVLEAIASDDGGVLTLTGAECESVTRYEPLRERWTEVDMPGVLDARGLATLDGDSWISHTAGKLTRVTHAPLAVTETYGLGSEGLQPFDSSAVSADERGVLWIASSTGGSEGTGVLTRFDVAATSVTAQTSLGLIPRPEGDMTGARRFSRLEPEGVATRVFTGCSRGGDDSESSEVATQWRALHITGVVGAGSQVEAQLRHATTVDELEQFDDEAFVSVGVLPDDELPFPLELPDGGVLELRLILRSTNYHGGPRVERVGLEWRCPGPD